jgi:hypothetical protein
VVPFAFEKLPPLKRIAVAPNCIAASMVEGGSENERCTEVEE